MLVSAVVLTAVVFTAFVGTAAAQEPDELDVTSTTVYLPDVASESVSVTSTYVMVNQQADEVVGERVGSFFYTKWISAVHANNVQVIETSSILLLDIFYRNT